MTLGASAISTLTPTVAVRLSGSGGQGLILAGRLLAEAATLHDGLDVVQTNSYGPEARGGASRSDLVLGRGEIDVLHSHRIDALVCLSQAACDAYYRDLLPGGLLITDGELVKVVPTTRVFAVPMARLARQSGNEMVANVVALAVLSAVSKLVSREALEATLRNRVPAPHRDANIQAIQAGFTAAEEDLARMSPKQRALYPEFGHLRTAPLPEKTSATPGLVATS
jgi:2-oxoglutarate ferredoxin oxidoreductase subunit gamma